MPAKPIGQSMIEANLINQYQLDELLDYQSRLDERTPLGKLSVELGLVKEEEFAPFLASYFDVPYLDLQENPGIQKEALDIVPQALAKRLNILPVAKEEDTLTVAVSDPLDLPVLESLEVFTRYRIKRVVSSANQIKDGISSYYSGQAIFRRTSRQTAAKKPKYRFQLAPSLVRLLIEKAINNNAGIVHIQPEENRIEIFFRIEGRLDKIASYPRSALPFLSEFIKRAAKLDLALRDTPQAGYFKYTNNGMNMEVGVSTLPTLTGERIVLEVPRRIGWADEESWFKSV